MTLKDFLYPFWQKKNEEHLSKEREKALAREELAQAIVTLERRSNTVTQIAQDAIKSMRN